MIDFCKFIYNLSAPDILNNQYLDFEFMVNDKTSEITSNRKAKFGDLQFTYYENTKQNNYIKIQGSLHKHFNFLLDSKIYDVYPNGFNGNDFNYSNIAYTLFDIKQRFNLDLGFLQLTNIEAGFNISPPIETPTILDGLILHNGKIFNRPKAHTYRQAAHTLFYIKCYDKALQYNLPTPLMRIENKFIKMQEVNKMGIYSAIDLLDKSKLELLKSDLVHRWCEVLFYDYTIDKRTLSTKQLSKIKDYANQTWWVRLKPNHRHRPKKEVQSITENHSHQIQNKIAKLIENKWQSLIVDCVINDTSSIRSNITQNNYFHTGTVRVNGNLKIKYI